MIDSGRRGLFTALSSAVKNNERRSEETPIVRPPYAPDKSAFQTSCPDCESKACAQVCEEKIIKIREDGTPELDFSERGCTFCDACAQACETGVLSDQTLNYIDVKVEIDLLKCVAWHDVMCSSCKDPCLENAIAFLGLFRPEIDMDKCTACGWCLHVCPTEAILLKPIG